ncbi:hypothetical protein HMN09_00366400 [Mycena chlorophos]|uniref:C2H2-type domain-containing protein n=1 Tax=Mycena chlorophos TaxID=658473 RepID=A0A8H6TJR3_MYCCL|nr:hypothetical protein HMN09_00366400 [Mycena chlorophos]
MPSPLHLAQWCNVLILCLLCTITSVVAPVAIPPPPAPSNGVIATYAPTYICPTSIAWDSASWYPIFGSYVYCTKTLPTTPETQLQCTYPLSNNGALQSSSGGTCPSSATQVITVSCALNCPASFSTSNLMQDTISGTTTTCYYGQTSASSMWDACAGAFYKDVSKEGKVVDPGLFFDCQLTHWRPLLLCSSAMPSPAPAVVLPSIHEMFPDFLLSPSPAAYESKTTIPTPFLGGPGLPPRNHYLPNAMPPPLTRPFAFDSRSGSQWHPAQAERPWLSSTSLSSSPPSGSPTSSSTLLRSPTSMEVTVINGHDAESRSSSASDGQDVDMEDDDEDGDDDGNPSTRKHACPQCAKRFNRPSSLRIHVNTHTGATPFRCPYPNCGRAFNVNSNMRRHYRNHSAALSAAAGAVAARPGTSCASTFSACSAADADAAAFGGFTRLRKGEVLGKDGAGHPSSNSRELEDAIALRRHNSTAHPRPYQPRPTTRSHGPPLPLAHDAPPPDRNERQSEHRTRSSSRRLSTSLALRPASWESSSTSSSWPLQA